MPIVFQVPTEFKTIDDNAFQDGRPLSSQIVTRMIDNQHYLMSRSPAQLVACTYGGPYSNGSDLYQINPLIVTTTEGWAEAVKHHVIPQVGYGQVGVELRLNLDGINLTNTKIRVRTLKEPSGNIWINTGASMVKGWISLGFIEVFEGVEEEIAIDVYNPDPAYTIEFLGISVYEVVVSQL